MEMRQAGPALGAQVMRCRGGDMSKKRQNVSETDETGKSVAYYPPHESSLRLSFGGSLESPAMLRKCKYAFLTLPNYSLIAVANAIEPLRMANRLVGKEIYQWSVVSMDGLAVDASSALNLSPTGALDELGAVDILFVCGGVNVREAVSPPVLTVLRRLADRRGAPGGVGPGGGAVGRGGVLDKFFPTPHLGN